jgi:VanZ family protein
MTAVTLACLLPAKKLPDAVPFIPHLDKIAHFIFYLVAILLAGLAFYRRNPQKENNRNYLYIFMGILFAYGGLIELLQLYLPGARSAEWTDILANTLGLLTGLASFKRLFHEVKALI